VTHHILIINAEPLHNMHITSQFSRQYKTTRFTIYSQHL